MNIIIHDAVRPHWGGKKVEKGNHGGTEENAENEFHLQKLL